MRRPQQGGAPLGMVDAARCRASRSVGAAYTASCCAFTTVTGCVTSGWSGQ